MITVDNAALTELQSEISEDLTAELKITDEASRGQLQVKVKNAIREVKLIRNYPDGYKDAQIVSDLENYYSVIRELSLYDYNQIGAEGVLSYSENGESRGWKDRMDCLKGVVAICRVV